MTWVILAALVAAVGLAIRHIVRTKKAGKCVGCPGDMNCDCGCSKVEQR